MTICRIFSSRRANLRIALSSAVLAAGISGCTTVRTPPPENPRDYAFITYFPPTDSKRLRVAVKDIIDVRGVVTTSGSQHFAETNPPAARDAACLKIARERGVHIVGKANVTELALGVSGMNEYFGTPKSPLKRRGKLIPGGSSSGSAVSVATGLADVSIGTDTAGSIRVPAACTGVYGLKTTYGLVPLDGVAPISPRHLDTVGPLAKDIPRLVQGMDLLQRGFAAKYRAAVAAQSSARGITIGRLYVNGTDPAIDQAVDAALASAGFRVVPLSREFAEAWAQAQKDGQNLGAADGWLSNKKFVNTLRVSLVTKSIIRFGELEYALNYKTLLERRLRWQRILKRQLQKVDFIALPTLQTVPASIPFWGRSIMFEAQVIAAQNTAAVNLAGNPALAVPIPMNDKRVPLTSVQLVGPRLSEARLINAGRLLTPRAQLAAAAQRSE